MTKKPNLPQVTEQTIIEVGNEAMADKDKLFNEMAVFNPTLFQLVLSTYKRADTNKETMLGICVACYVALDRQMGKSKQLRKRVRGNGH